MEQARMIRVRQIVGVEVEVMETESTLRTGRKIRSTSTLVYHGHRALSCERAT